MSKPGNSQGDFCKSPFELRSTAVGPRGIQGVKGLGLHDILQDYLLFSLVWGSGEITSLNHPFSRVLGEARSDLSGFCGAESEGPTFKSVEHPGPQSKLVAAWYL